MDMELVEVEIDRIVVGNMIRRDMGDLGTLENSVKQFGLLFPLLINRDNVLLSGSRRLAACRKVGLTKVPALRVDVAEDGMAPLDIQCQENYCRKELTMEELESEIAQKKAILARTHRPTGVGLWAKIKAWFTADMERERA
ncbi:MAG: ParB N-terminal domain-containing protein [Kiritimatiellae bacterium]|nr:ParB N-terminal domain-containing protein [Kiritimatiellia bacterium]